MNEDQPDSGSRWEPADGATNAHLTTPMAPGPVPADAEGATTARRPRRAALAAAGVGLVLAGGLGGFAIGHTVAAHGATQTGTVTDSHDEGVPDGFPGGRSGGRPNVGGGEAVPGAPFDGTAPDGTAPEGSTPDQPAPGGAGADGGSTA